MDLMTRLQQAAAQTWWLPPSASIHEDDECSYYEHGGSYRVVRFSPHPKRQDACLRTICERAGAAPLSFDYFSHQHGADLADRLVDFGFTPGIRYEARAIHVDAYLKVPPSGLTVIRVETLAQIKQAYATRSAVFGDGQTDTDETLERYLRNATGPAARAPQFIVQDQITGEIVSQAGMSIYPELGVAFLFAGGTLKAGRGRGAYTALVAARIEYARSIGLEYVGLFADEHTSSPIVERHGFDCVGEMRVWNRNH